MQNLFSFNAQTETPAMLAERRARAAALAGQIGGNQTYGGGIGDIFRGLAAGLTNYRSDQAQREGESSWQGGVDELMGVLDQPPSRPLSTPNNDTVMSGLKQGLATGTVPPLATYTPGGAQTAGMPDNRQQPSYAPPEPPPVAEGEMPPQMDPNIQQAGYTPPPPPSAEAAMLPKIRKMLDNPWVPDGTKAILQKRYDDIVKKMDPDHQYDQQMKRTKDEMEIAKAKIELHNLQNPDKKYEQWDDGAGNLWVYDKADPAGTKQKIVSAGDSGKLVGKPKEGVEVANNLRMQPATQALAQQLPVLKSLYNSINQGGSVSDLSFIYGVAKALDPIGSVREGDASNIINSVGASQAVMGEIRKAISGEGALSRDTRVKLFELAQSRTKEFYDAAMLERAQVSRQLDLGGWDQGNMPEQPQMPKWQEQSNPTRGDFVGPEEVANASREGREVRIPKVRVWNPATGAFQ